MNRWSQSFHFIRHERSKLILEQSKYNDSFNNHRPLIQLLCKSASLKLYVRIEQYNIPLYHTMVDMDRPNQNHKVAKISIFYSNKLKNKTYNLVTRYYTLRWPKYRVSPNLSIHRRQNASVPNSFFRRWKNFLAPGVRTFVGCKIFYCKHCNMQHIIVSVISYTAYSKNDIIQIKY